ncbi:unnamed protein product [Ixodes pacificus]
MLRKPMTSPEVRSSYDGAKNAPAGQQHVVVSLPKTSVRGPTPWGRRVSQRGCPKTPERASSGKAGPRNEQPAAASRSERRSRAVAGPPPHQPWHARHVSEGPPSSWTWSTRDVRRTCLTVPVDARRGSRPGLRQSRECGALRGDRGPLDPTG